jgi:hypothetical protein
MAPPGAGGVGVDEAAGAADAAVAGGDDDASFVWAWSD